MEPMFDTLILQIQQQQPAELLFESRQARLYKSLRTWQYIDQAKHPQSLTINFEIFS